VSKRVEEFLLELGVARADSVENTEWFEVEGGEGDGLEVIEPAVIETTDDGTRTVVRLGRASRSRTVGTTSTTPNVPPTGAGDPPSRGALAVSVGIAVLIVGFFLGWTVASVALDESGASRSAVVTEVESAS